MPRDGSLACRRRRSGKPWRGWRSGSACGCSIAARAASRSPQKVPGFWSAAAASLPRLKRPSLSCRRRKKLRAARSLGMYRRRLVAAPAYLAARGVPLSPGDLKAHACLRHMFPTSRRFGRWPLGPENAGIESELPKTVVASTLEPLIYMAEQGMGIAYLPDFAISRQLREGLSSPCSTIMAIVRGRYGCCGHRAGKSLPSSELSWIFSPRTWCHPSRAKHRKLTSAER
jgi:LysR substrate binding domain-containing protein